MREEMEISVRLCLRIDLATERHGIQPLSLFNTLPTVLTNYSLYVRGLRRFARLNAWFESESHYGGLDVAR